MHDNNNNRLPKNYLHFLTQIIIIINYYSCQVGVEAAEYTTTPFTSKATATIAAGSFVETVSRCCENAVILILIYIELKLTVNNVDHRLQHCPDQLSKHKDRRTTLLIPFGGKLASPSPTALQVIIEISSWKGVDGQNINNCTARIRCLQRCERR